MKRQKENPLLIHDRIYQSVFKCNGILALIMVVTESGAEVPDDALPGATFAARDLLRDIERDSALMMELVRERNNNVVSLVKEVA